MKNWLTIAVVVAAFAATLTFVAASSIKREPVTTEADVLPAYEIVTTVRGMGLNPIGEPLRRGPYYVLHAIDRRGAEMRVVADAQLGDILSVAPAQRPAAANYQRGPRIIQVPQPGDRASASVNERDEPAATNDDDDEDVAPAPKRRAAPPPVRATPRWPARSETPPPPQRRSDVPPPPPPGPRRAVLSAPPPPAEGPSPVRPTPRYNTKIDSGEKFGAPRDAALNAPPPPPGYTPPSAIPHAD